MPSRPTNIQSHLCPHVSQPLSQGQPGRPLPLSCSIAVCWLLGHHSLPGGSSFTGQLEVAFLVPLSARFFNSLASEYRKCKLGCELSPPSTHSPQGVFPVPGLQSHVYASDSQSYVCSPYLAPTPILLLPKAPPPRLSTWPPAWF